MTSWWGMKEALKSQKDMYVFQTHIEQTFHELTLQEQAFSAEDTILQSRLIYDHIQEMKEQMSLARKESRDTEHQEQLAIILATLSDYHTHFTKYVQHNLDLQTIHSRMDKEAKRFHSRVNELDEHAVSSHRVFGLATNALLTQKDFIISPQPNTYKKVTDAITQTLELLSLLQQQNPTVKIELPIYRVTKTATSFAETFHDFANQYDIVQSAHKELRHTFYDLRREINRSIAIEALFANKQIQFFQAIIITTAIFAIVFCISATLILSEFITKPIEMLKKSAIKIVNGDLNTSVDITSRDEIGELGHLFNEMTGKLRISFQELEKYKDKLEHLVKERTYELELEITERREAVNELIASEKRFRTFFDNSTDGILIADPATQGLILANRTICDMLGYTEKEILTLNVKSLHPPEAQNQAVKEFNEMTRDERNSSKDILVTRKDGSIFPAEITSTTIELGNQQYLLGCFRDISERKAVEAERLKIRKLESVGILAGGIAHDFNNILSAILGNVSLTLALTDSHDKRFKLLKELEKASIRARDLTQQLLTFSKGGEPVKELTSIVDIIRESASFILRGSRVRCDFILPDDHDLWGAEVDPGQISQVIQNIVVNAKQAMPDGGVITIRCRNITPSDQTSGDMHQQKYLEIRITDTGPGIPENLIEHVFDPYFTTKNEGSGLGLAITHSIVNKHNGTISATSTPGHGTTFNILLPAVDLPHHATLPTAKLQTEPASGTIMVMDDEIPVREIAEQLLLHLGYSVITVPDGETALREYRNRQYNNNPVDIVIMDLTIPGGMGGQETAKKILAIDPNARLIVSSGYSHDPIMANYTNFGFKGFLSKPYHLHELQMLLLRILKDNPTN